MRMPYDVVVRNELTGEVAAIRVLSENPADAQVEALLQQFKTRGWRKSVAFQVDVVSLSISSSAA